MEHQEIITVDYCFLDVKSAFKESESAWLCGAFTAGHTGSFEIYV